MNNRENLNWMLAKSIETLARAERLQRQMFRSGAPVAPGRLGAAGRRAGDRARGADPGRPARRRSRPVEVGDRGRHAGRRRPRVLPPELRDRRDPPAGAAAGPLRAAGAAARRPLRRRAPVRRQRLPGGQPGARPAERRSCQAADHVDRRPPPASAGRPPREPADPAAAGRRADHRAGARHRAVPRHRRCRSRVGRPRSIAAAQQAVREQRPGRHRACSATPRRRSRGPTSCTASAWSPTSLRYITAPDGTHHHRLPGRAALPHPRVPRRAAVPGGARCCSIPEPDAACAGDRGALPAPAAARRWRRSQLLPQAPQELVEAIQAIDLARRARRPGRRLHGHQAGGEAGDPGDARPRRAAWTRSRACWRSGSRCCGCRQEIGQQTRAALDERQREALLREQMAAIQRELGEGDGKAAGDGGADRGDRQGRHARGGRGAGAQGAAPAASACRKQPPSTA